MPFIMAKQAAGSKPLNIFLWAYPIYQVVNAIWVVFYYFTIDFRTSNGLVICVRSYPRFLDSLGSIG